MFSDSESFTNFEFLTTVTDALVSHTNYLNSFLLPHRCDPQQKQIYRDKWSVSYACISKLNKLLKFKDNQLNAKSHLSIYEYTMKSTDDVLMTKIPQNIRNDFITSRDQLLKLIKLYPENDEIWRQLTLISISDNNMRNPRNYYQHVKENKELINKTIINSNKSTFVIFKFLKAYN